MNLHVFAHFRHSYGEAWNNSTRVARGGVAFYPHFCMAHMIEIRRANPFMVDASAEVLDKDKAEEAVHQMTTIAD